MFLLNLMLLLQPLLEPNGEKGSENHTHTNTNHVHLVYQCFFSPNVYKKKKICSPLTSGGLCKLLRAFPLPQHQAQGHLADRFPRRSSRSGEEVCVVLRDEAGGHVSGLKLRVARETQ